jgi:hypothetical protein
MHALNSLWPAPFMQLSRYITHGGDMGAVNSDIPDNPSPEVEVEIDTGNNPDEVNFDPTKEGGSEKD